MSKDAILFGGTDPGRFCPTYMIFCESFIPHKDQPLEDQKFDRRDVYIITQNALADPTYLEYIRAHILSQAHADSTRHSSRNCCVRTIREGPELHHELGSPGAHRLQIARQAVHCQSTAPKIEARRLRKEGVYPPKEIYCPTPEDSHRSVSTITCRTPQQRLRPRHAAFPQ